MGMSSLVRNVSPHGPVNLRGCQLRPLRKGTTPGEVWLTEKEMSHPKVRRLIESGALKVMKTKGSPTPVVAAELVPETEPVTVEIIDPAPPPPVALVEAPSPMPSEDLSLDDETLDDETRAVFRATYELLLRLAPGHDGFYRRGMRTGYLGCEYCPVLRRAPGRGMARRGGYLQPVHRRSFGGEIALAPT